MYPEDNNTYHYTYRSDNQPGQSFNGGYSYRPDPEVPPKKKKKHTGVKIAALALSCALLGGAVGGGAVYMGLQQAAPTTHVNVSARPSAEVVVHQVDGNRILTDAEVYAANVNSVVSINTKISGGTNIFGQVTESASAGSGFILTADGFIVTNYHVVENANTIHVDLYNGETYDATYVGGDEDYDIAVIKVNATGLTPVTLGDSEALSVGDRVLAVGNPLGELTFSMSGGMVSSVNRTINVSGTPFNMIQTDTSINPGNSGGPLFNQYGEVVGIVSAKYSSYASQGVEGLGFAIPMNDVSAMIEDIMTNGYITNKPYLGITGGTMTAQMAAQYRYDVEEGVFIYSTEKGYAADLAGLKLGDVITKVDDMAIKSMTDLNSAKKKYSAGDTAVFTIYREGQSVELDVTWSSLPPEEQSNESEQPATQTPQYGGNYNPFDMFEYFFGNRYR